jgi:hypothetical protein
LAAQNTLLLQRGWSNPKDTRSSGTKRFPSDGKQDLNMKTSNKWASSSVTDIYSRQVALDEQFRGEEWEREGIGFSLPQS